MIRIGKTIQNQKSIIEEERTSPSVKSKSKNKVYFNPKVTEKNIERRPSKVRVPVKNSQQKNESTLKTANSG